MLVPSRNVIPSWTPRCWAKSSSRSHTPRWAQRMNICAARDQGPSSAGMARHLAPFSWRQRMAEMVRRRSFGCVLPLGRHASTNGSKFVHCASDTIALSSFQKEQNARHHKQFKREQALDAGEVRPIRTCPRRSSSSVKQNIEKSTAKSISARHQENSISANLTKKIVANKPVAKTKFKRAENKTTCPKMRRGRIESVGNTFRVDHQ